ncbi:unnamed protein product [Adineta ricciae]|uniref:Uncharacterized protein n=1 Tax=Adineta ricciae TaxID=249248 RepID=A0A814MUH0_ADIRI|nr:unnamed protein product [Adineta ricciae]CAF1648455.1 unnamed protein product [Adineta ricciae]
MKRKCELDQGNERLKKFTIDCNETSFQINQHSIFDRNTFSQNEQIKTHAGEEMEQEYSLERMEALDPKVQYNVNNNCFYIQNDSVESDISNNIEDYDHHEFDEISALKSLLTIMHPTETILYTIKRLRVAATNNRFKQRAKQQQFLLSDLTSEESTKNKYLLEEITGLVDRFVSNGQPDIYHETYEQLKAKLNP